MQLRQLALLPVVLLAFLGCSVSPNPTGEASARTSGASSPGSPEAGSSESVAPEVVPPELGAPDAEGPVGDLLFAEISTVGWDQLSGSPIVLLRELESGQSLPIWIGIAEARAIHRELHGVEPPRPMTHDLMASLLRGLEAELEQVVIHDLRDGTYFGLLKLRLEGRSEARWIDSRPSDGLALALRTDAKILVARKLIEEQPEYQFQPPEESDQVVRAVGLTVVAPDDAWKRELSLPERPGLVVIAARGEAKRQGLRRGDLIVGLNGRVPQEPLDLLEAIAETPAGEALEVTYWRDGQESSARLNLEVPDRPQVDRVA